MRQCSCLCLGLQKGPWTSQGHADLWSPLEGGRGEGTQGLRWEQRKLRTSSLSSAQSLGETRVATGAGSRLCPPFVSLFIISDRVQTWIRWDVGLCGTPDERQEEASESSVVCSPLDAMGLGTAGVRPSVSASFIPLGIVKDPPSPEAPSLLLSP